MLEIMVKNPASALIIGTTIVIILGLLSYCIRVKRGFWVKVKGKKLVELGITKSK